MYAHKLYFFLIKASQLLFSTAVCKWIGEVWKSSDKKQASVRKLVTCSHKDDLPPLITYFPWCNHITKTSTKVNFIFISPLSTSRDQKISFSCTARAISRENKSLKLIGWLGWKMKKKSRMSENITDVRI